MAVLKRQQWHSLHKLQKVKFNKTCVAGERGRFCFSLVDGGWSYHNLEESRVLSHTEIDRVKKIIPLQGREQEKNVFLEFSNLVISMQASRKYKRLPCEETASEPYH